MPELNSIYNKELNKSLFLLIDELDDSIIECDNLQGIITNCNKSTVRLYGYEKEELAGRSIYDLFDENNKSEAGEILEKLKCGIKIPHFETIKRKKNGERIIVSTSISPIYDVNNKVRGMICISRNMTEKYRLIDEIIDSKEKYKLAIESGNFAIWDCNLKTEEVYYSKRWKEMLGYKEDEIGTSYSEWIKRIHKDDLGYALDSIKKHFNGEDLKIEYRLKCRNGSYIWVKSIGKITRWKNGKPLRMVGLNADINEEMVRRKKIVENENRLKGIYDSISIGLGLGEIILDDKGNPVNYRFLNVNDAMEKIIGRKIQNFNKALKEIHKNEYILDILSKAALKGKKFKFQIHNKNASKYFLINIYSPNPLQFAFSLTDITEAKNREKELSDKYRELSVVYQKLAAIEEELRANYNELKEANEKVIKANKAKNQFLANMSHELRTPLNGILGFTQLLQLSDINEEQREELDMIESSSKYLLKLINSILDLSKIDAGKIELSYNRFDFKEQMDLVIKEMMLLAENKDIQIMYFIDPLINKELIGDIIRLRQILNNLINNAVKFTETGYIFFNVKKVYSNAGETKLEFSVEDTGKGISDEFKNRIFSEFTQEEDIYTKNYGGTGLELAISKRLVILMGGDIWVESEKGKGSKFYFTLVFRNFQNENQISSKMNIGTDRINNNKFILIAEDNEINLKIISAYLKKLNYKFKLVKNGIEAVNFLDKNKADIVLMDIQMPVLDGIDAVRIIRDREKLTGKHQIIIAMTAYVMAGDREKLLESGMDGYISKPFDMEALSETLSRW